MNARGLLVAHDEYSVAGMIGDHAQRQGVDLVPVVPSAGEPFPDPRDFDFVQLMGAPWSVHDAEIAHWVCAEQDMLRTAIEADVPILGICFGAQIVASVIGGAVFRAERGEYGWAPVETFAPELIPAGPWLHWHGDAFTVPQDVEVLARTASGTQAYRFGRTLCVQFHPEADRRVVGPWVSLSPGLLAREGVDGEALLEETERRAQQSRPRAEALFDRFLAGVDASL